MESLRAFKRAALRVKTSPAREEPSEKAGRKDGDGEESLARSLGLGDLVLMGIGGSIGAGIFVVTGTVALDAGPGVAVSFALAGAASALNALCYAELSTRFPARVGGAYLYAYSAFNELTAFLVFANLMLDYHIGAASIVRSLASYVVTVLELIPGMPSIPAIIGSGGLELFGGWLSVDLLAPVLLALLTLLLCQGVRESSIVNGIMTISKIVIVLLVIVAGSIKVDTSNWIPFAPNGVPAIMQGATIAFFSYVGFDAVANSAEETKNPKRDLPIAILGSVLACTTLYIGVCLVVTGMVPYYELDGSAPLVSAFVSRGMTSISILISVGAVAGLTTTLLVGLYVQSRLYLGLGRDGLLMSTFARVHPAHQTPVAAQIWVGLVAGVLSLLIDVSHLSHILSVGCLTGYSVVSACVLVLRITPESDAHVPRKDSQAAIGSILATAILGFGIGLCYRLGAHPAIGVALFLLNIVFVIPMYTHQEYIKPIGFCVPFVPTLPLFAILVNMFLFALLHYEAWIRFGVVSGLAVVIYALYGQHNSKVNTAVDRKSSLDQRAPLVNPDGFVET